MEDIVNMSPQERFEFFVDHQQIAFLMFQDALEYVVLDETTYSDNIDDGDDEEDIVNSNT